MVEAGLGGEDIAFFKGVVPGGVEMGGLVGIETDAVAEVVEKGTGQVGVEQGFGVVEEVAAAEAGFDEALNFGEDVGDGGVGGELGVGGVAIDGEGAAVVGEVTAEGGAEIEDEEFTCLGGARAWGAAGGVALVVVASGGEGLAEGVDGGGLEFVEDGELGDAGGDDFPGASVHGLAGGDGVAEEGELVGVLAAAEAVEGGLDVVQRWGEVVAEGGAVGGGTAGGFEADASVLVGRGVGLEEGGDGVFLVLAEGAEPLGFKGQDVAGGVVLGDLVGGNEEALIWGQEDGGAVVG